MTSISTLNKTEYILLQCLRRSLCQSDHTDFLPVLSAQEWQQVLSLADRHEVLSLLEQEGIKAVTLKGCTVARFYPVPEFRKTTDIDLFVNGEEIAKKAEKILSDYGFQPSGEWHANHHVVLVSKKKEVVELHTAWAEVFKEKHWNQYLKKVQKESWKHCQWIDFQGMQVYAYETAWQGFYLLIHMLQNFVGSGCGLLKRN